MSQLFGGRGYRCQTPPTGITGHTATQNCNTSSRAPKRRRKHRTATPATIWHDLLKRCGKIEILRCFCSKWKAFQIQSAAVPCRGSFFGPFQIFQSVHRYPSIKLYMLIEGPRRPNNSQLMPAFGLQFDKCVLNYNLIPECLRFCVHRCDLHSSDCHRLDDGSQAPAKGSPAAGDRQPAGSRAREILGEESGSLQSLVLSGMGCSVNDQVSRLDVTHRKVAWSVCNTGRWVPCSSRGASCLECAPAK